MTGKRIVMFAWAGKTHVHSIRWARGLAGRGLSIKLISLGGEDLEGIDTTVLPRSGKLSYVSQVRMAVKEARRFGPHLIHAHYATGFGYWAYRTRFRPSIISVWGSDVVDFPKTWLKRAFLRRILDRATVITATSDYLKQKTLDILPSASDRIEVIPFGVDVPESYQPLVPGSPLKICYLKSLYPIYGPDILLRALARVKEQLPDVKLTMAGEGPMKEKLMAMVEELGLAEDVTFVGQIEESEIGDFIDRHHFMVMPSLQESFGVAALEAGARGRAVVASEVGGVPEVVIDGKTGVLVPPNDLEALADSILALSGDFDRLQQMGNEGHSFVRENYSWDKSLDKMAALYERLIDEAQ